MDTGFLRRLKLKVPGNLSFGPTGCSNPRIFLYSQLERRLDWSKWLSFFGVLRQTSSFEIGVLLQHRPTALGRPKNLNLKQRTQMSIFPPIN
jgi:hypothetical protein